LASVIKYPERLGVAPLNTLAGAMPAIRLER